MAKRGVPKKIESPEMFWALFEGYKQYIEDNPRYKHELDKFGNIVPIPLRCPLTMEGFECYVMDHTTITYPDLTHYFENTENRYSDFVPISARIRREIRQDQLSGGMVGQFNSSLTARMNNLTDKIETTIKEQPLFPDED